MLDASLIGVDDDLANQIVAVAYSIAPCLDTLTEGPERNAAIAILRGVAAEAKSRGSRLVKSQRIGPASVDYTSADSWFSSDVRAALRALCGPGAVSGTPIGRFPKAGLLTRLWPEEEDA